MKVDPPIGSLTATIAQVSEVVGRTLSAEAIAMMAARLEREDRSLVNKALTRCMDECKGRFSLADILDRMPDQPIGADAAWEMAMRLNIGDEDATVIAPHAILAAFPHALWRDGDKIAARMAFKDAWPRALEAWGMGNEVSEGNNPERREPAIMEAVANNLISPRMAQVLLPHMVDEIAALVRPANVPLLAKGGEP